MLALIGGGWARWDRPNRLKLEFSASQCGLFLMPLYFLQVENISNLKQSRRSPHLAVSYRMDILPDGNY